MQYKLEATTRLNKFTYCLNFFLKSVAATIAKITASGSSPLTWIIGAANTLPTAVQYTEDLDIRGSVVKPI